MNTYISQTKTLDGVIFNYVNDANIVESIYYTTAELEKLASKSPEFGEGYNSLKKS